MSTSSRSPGSCSSCTVTSSISSQNVDVAGIFASGCAFAFAFICERVAREARDVPELLREERLHVRERVVNRRIAEHLAERVDEVEDRASSSVSNAL